ncbi:MAG: 50S ribosomal protein L15 [Myxococcales bacterium]|nr:50S ribosomal protein L15 [Myxococcales bacterium]
MAKAEAASAKSESPILSRLSPPEGAVRGKRRRGRGRGSQLGKTSGHGQKGQKARHPGNFSKVGYEGGQTPLHRRLPKFGFTNPFTLEVATLNVKDLARFEKGTTVDLQALRRSGLVKGNFDRVKVLGNGELDRALTVSARSFSESAKAKIEKAGGSCQVLEVVPPKPVVRHKNKIKKRAS